MVLTERLNLRLHGAGDFDASAAMWADPEVVRHIGGVPSTRQLSWNRLLCYIGHWTLLGYGYWVVEERATGQFIGEVGFADFHRDIEPSLDGIPELGWALVPSAHGKGYATEAVRAALTWAKEHLHGASRVASIIAPENLASIRVAHKCGLLFWQEGRYRDQPVSLYERDLAD
jgi:RimJ/RimL family protein N-acetyltransferase